jgi:uncharacterized protein YodC (DUF2158 family)
MATTKVILSGPLFTGEAAAAAQDFANSLAGEIAQIGATWIKVEAQGYDKSGRGGTGQAAEGVKVAGQGGRWTISGGISKGSYAWPWLEGTSKRNQSTGFKGYHTFRRTRLRMRKQVTPWAQEQIEAYLLQMGGGEA